MTQLINEAKRFQKLAGILKENDQPSATDVEQVADKVEAPLEAKIDTLTPEQIEQLKADLASLGITANTSAEEVIDKVEGPLSEAQGNEKQKVANVLSGLGTGIIATLFAPIIPVAVGSAMGVGFGGGLAATLAAGGLLIALAKALGKKEGSTEFGNN